MSLLIKNERCVSCRELFIVSIELKEDRKVLDVECPYCKKVGELIGTKIIKIERNR
jgi:phage FluMu protein Com